MNIKIGHLNIRGWGRQYRDMKAQILQYTECDLISLNETWLREQSDSIVMPNYKWFGHNRQLNNKRALKGSGGVGILVANHILSAFDVTVIDKQLDGLLALSFCHKETNYKFILITAYIPPENSIYGRDSSGFFLI